MTRVREDLFEQSTELFYEAAAVPELWPQALQSLSDATGAMGVNLLPIRPGPDGAICSNGIRGYLDEFIAGGWLRINPYMRRGLQLTRAGWRGLITSEDMLSSEELARDPYVNEVEMPAGFGPKAGMVLVSSGEEFVLPLSIERGIAAGPFTRQDIALLNPLMERFRPAAALALKVGFTAAQHIADSIAVIGKCVALIGGSGKLLHIAPGLERYFDDVFICRSGTLCSWNPAANRLLTEAIGKSVSYAPAAERVVRTMTLPRKCGKRPVKVQIVPITGAAQDVFFLARAVLILTDPEDFSDDAADLIAAHFGLSRAETRLARRIAAGEDLREIATAENINIETARSRLKAVFSKTDTHRQTELALLLTQFLN